MDLKNLSVAELLKTYVGVLDELRAHEISRTANSPTGDYAEWLFCRAFGWQQAANSVKGYDAKDESGIRYQIKGRWLHAHNKSRQLSQIRDLDGFKVLAGVLFDADFGVFRAALIPSEIIRERSKFIKHTNSHRFVLSNNIWDLPGVRDVTDKLRHQAETP